MNVIDGFTFFNELDLLELRLNILYEKVDYFILVEAVRTHSNKIKPLYYEENKERFKKFKSKIIHVIIDFPLSLGVHTWALENYQRECIKEGLKKIPSLQQQDVLLISDLDEILRPSVIDTLRQQEKTKYVCAFKMPIFYYYLNLKFVEDPQNYYNFLYPSRGCTLGVLEDYNNSLQTIRTLSPNSCDFIIESAGWHWSFLSDPKGIKEKIEAFAHQEHNNPKNTSLTNIREKMKKGEDAFGRFFQWKQCEIDTTYPSYILENLEKFKHFIK